MFKSSERLIGHDPLQPRRTEPFRREQLDVTSRHCRRRPLSSGVAMAKLRSSAIRAARRLDGLTQQPYRCRFCGQRTGLGWSPHVRGAPIPTVAAPAAYLT
jgi:hypothetical protein